MIKPEDLARTTFSRDESWAKAFLWMAFLPFRAMGRMLIEAFIRRDFGERYFTRAAVIRVFLLLSLCPFVLDMLSRGLSSEENASGSDVGSFLFRYSTWYLYLAAFLYVAFRRLDEIKHLPSALDLKRYSLSSGRIHDFFWEFNFRGRKGDERFIECWLEPAPFFLAGLLLALISQPLGWLLIFSSIAYSVSYHSAYNKGDNLVMSIADKIIIQKNLKEVFMEDADMQETMGVNWRGQKPADMTTRREVFNHMAGTEDGFLVE